MIDPRIGTLARNLLGYSLEIKAGDRLQIEGETGCEPLVLGLLEEAYRMGVVPLFEVVYPSRESSPMADSCRCGRHIQGVAMSGPFGGTAAGTVGPAGR